MRHPMQTAHAAHLGYQAGRLAQTTNPTESAAEQVTHAARSSMLALFYAEINRATGQPYAVSIQQELDWSIAFFDAWLAGYRQPVEATVSPHLFSTP